MRTIIAGSRSIIDQADVDAAVVNSGFTITTVISGTARGVDRMGEVWASRNGVPIERYPADWSRGVRAGHERNRVMGDVADALIAVWDGRSSGTDGMIRYAQHKGLPVFVHIPTHAYVAYCDGASRKDGRGGWGASIRRAGYQDVDLFGGEMTTTNNRMELTAPIEVMWYLPEGSSIRFVCDSDYVVKGFSEYLDQWEAMRWRTAANKPLKNDDLWKEARTALQRHAAVEFEWVKGHSGNPGNERADALSQMGVPPGSV